MSEQKPYRHPDPVMAVLLYLSDEFVEMAQEYDDKARDQTCQHSVSYSSAVSGAFRICDTIVLREIIKHINESNGCEKSNAND